MSYRKPRIVGCSRLHMVRLRLGLRVLVVLGTGVVHGNAQAAKTPAQQVVAARRLCGSGQPDAGVAILEELYLATHEANLIYNQGRCYEANGRSSDALDSYHRFLLLSPNLKERERADVQARVDSLLDRERAQAALSSGSVVTSPEQPQAEVTTLGPPSAQVESSSDVSSPAENASAPTLRKADLGRPADAALAVSSIPPAPMPAAKPIPRWAWYATAAVVVLAAGTTIALLSAHKQTTTPDCSSGDSCVVLHF